jgi:hypothetical protein
VVECSALEQHLFAAASAGPLSEKVARLFHAHAHGSGLDGDSSTNSRAAGSACADGVLAADGRQLRPPTAQGAAHDANEGESVSAANDAGAGCSVEASAAVRWRLVFAQFDVGGRGVVAVAALEAGVAQRPALARALGLPSNVTAEGATSLRLRIFFFWGGVFYAMRARAAPTPTAEQSMNIETESASKRAALSVLSAAG